MNDKAIPLRELSRVREQRRKLQAKVALLEAKKQGWLAEKARLVAALESQRGGENASIERK